MNQNTIQCPSCGESISIDDVLTKQLEAKVIAKQQDKAKALAKQEAELTEQKEALSKEQEQFNDNVKTQVAAQLGEERTKLMRDMRADADKENQQKMQFLEEQIKQKDEKLTKATEEEVAWRKEKARFADEKRTFEVEKLRQLEEEKSRIQEQAKKEAAEEQQLEIAQLNKKIEDVTKANADLARKLAQGSQQTQGEVLELALEDVLKTEFPLDKIEPVPKGVRGVDIVHQVISRTGRVCGKIAWEFKRTKSWSEGWIRKLKDDQREIKAEFAVIVSTALPDEAKGKGFIYRDNVWICEIKYVTALALALRGQLEAVSREKAMSVGKNEKMEVLYHYLTGVEFRQRVEAIIDTFTVMETSLRKERTIYEKQWAEREKQIRKVLDNTVGMYGDLSGLVALPQIKHLEFNTED